MPMNTRDKRGKRARDSSEEVDDPDTQLERESSYTDLVRCWLNTLY